MKFPIGSMTVGDVLDRGLKLLLSRLPMFYVINLITSSPVIIMALIWPEIFLPTLRGAVDPQASAINFVAFMSAMALAIIGTQIGTAAMLRVVLNDFTGSPVSLGDAFSFALKRFGRLLFATILAGLIIFVGSLCIFPGIFFFVSYIFVSQVVVAEGLRGEKALSRSWKLVSGHRWRVFGTVLLILLAMLVVSVLLGLALGAALPLGNSVQTARGLEFQINEANVRIKVIVDQLVNILFSTYLAVCTTLLYLDMRIRKEGLDLELQAQEMAGA